MAWLAVMLLHQLRRRIIERKSWIEKKPEKKGPSSIHRASTRLCVGEVVGRKPRHTASCTRTTYKERVGQSHAGLSAGLSSARLCQGPALSVHGTDGMFPFPVESGETVHPARIAAGCLG